MNFATAQYFAFFAIVFVTYWALPRRQQNVFLCLASYAFYAAWDWRFLSLILLSTVIDFVAGGRIHRATSQVTRRGWLMVSLVVNLGVLGWFKYFNFFADGFVDLLNAFGLHASQPTIDIILPVGISFYTFQTLSYSLDIYFRKLEPTQRWIDFAAFVAFFPQLVAGPIVRAREFLYQLEQDRRFNARDFEDGAIRFLVGLFKKTFVADTIGVFLVDPVFADPTSFDSPTLWLAMFGYGAQIYADFSGYSSMAIGSAKMLGFSIPENFEFPYLARDISDFWRRWHMTMSRFFRDYVYIPLGGNRFGRPRTLANLAATTLISGLWHGAGWNFVIWGGLHGVYLACNQVVRDRRTNSRERIPIWRIGASWAATFLVVHFAWILFRAPDFATSILYLEGLFLPTEGSPIEVPTLVTVAFAVFAIEHLIGWLREREALDLTRLPVPVRAVTFVTLVIFLFHARPTAVDPFIYFQF